MSDFPVPWGNYLLEGLAETQAPESISWFPQTIGWQCVLFIVIIIFARKSYQAVKRYQHNVYRRNALSWISKLPQYNASSPDAIFRQLPSLLRKVALYSTERADVCLLAKHDWELWLDEQCCSKNKLSLTSFSEKNTSLLYQLAYVPNYQIDNEKMHYLIADISTWIKHHRGKHD